ncbi:Ubiquitin carboxyl-terminal hydrolase 12 [Quillaja saponaria]|uniref:Ubiquitin carboxyl-terminal hydrolase 12 n=1 Tax=Quillaja saponaria TaxID=32244 RepID=A0AAD7VCW3_QUISA|nr:Ubiquitin carboxyl-terminal hydrolase 12 [Quillaja saponaria]
MPPNTMDKFTWTIRNFSKLNTEKHYSEVFSLGGCQWRILVFPNGNNVNHLSVYLDAADSANLPQSWSRFADFNLTLINQINSNYSLTKKSLYLFNGGESDWGFTSFVPLDNFRDPINGYLVKDTCIIEAEVTVIKVGVDNEDDQATGITTTTKIFEDGDGQVEVEGPKHEDQGKEPADPALFKELKNMPSTDINELVDFRDLGEAEKAFVPLLEEVCSWYPSLIECQRKRSRMFTQWAFTALGRVLHFLKTTKVKNMTKDECEHLQVLWEELKVFKFELSWLEPHVEFALGMKTYLENEEQVTKLKDSVAALDKLIKRVKENMAVVEEEVGDEKRKYLANLEEGFKERDMYTELGICRLRRTYSILT